MKTKPIIYLSNKIDIAKVCTITIPQSLFKSKLSFFQFTSDSSLYTREPYLLKFNTLHLALQTQIYKTNLYAQSKLKSPNLSN